MPDALEFPRMLSAVVPLVRAGDTVVFKFVANGLPGFTAVVGALNQLAEPAAALRCVQAVGVGRRTFEMENFPSGEVRPGDLPIFTLAIGSEKERAFACPHQ